jgi:hypothetical protein
MNVKELIEILQRYDGDTEIGFTYNYGDYWKTDVVETISDVLEAGVKHSDYFNMLTLVDPYDDQRDEPVEPEKTMLVITG